MIRTNKHYFQDMLDYAKSSLEFTSGLQFEELLMDKKVIFATVRALEVVGEASNRISEEVKEKYPFLPWIEMRGLRNRIIHNYDDIDYEIVWKVFKNEIPKLIQQIELIIDEIE